MFERTRVRPDGLRVETVIDFQDEEKENVFADLYERQGKATTNFALTLPERLLIRNYILHFR